jgi:DNA-binding SARP family transcriptional activator
MVAGWEHLAAIAFHNLGTVQRSLGLVDESVASLEHSYRYWTQAHVSPFADNSQLTISLLTTGNVKAAERVAERGLMSTRPWARPHAEARLAVAQVLIQQCRIREARDLLQSLLASPAQLGSLAEEIAVALSEAYYLLQPISVDWTLVAQTLAATQRDPRFQPLAVPAEVILRHHTTRCRGGCQQALTTLTSWEQKGAVLPAIVGHVKVGALVLEHGPDKAIDLNLTWLQRANERNLLPYLRHWLRTYRPYLASLVQTDGGRVLIARFLQLDPEFWREPVARILPELNPSARAVLLTGLSHVGNKETLAALAEVAGPDVAIARRQLIRRQAPRLFVRTFGGLTIQAGRPSGREILVDKPRLRSLLGLIVTQSGKPVGRDVVLDTLWPDASPAAAVNNLNQAVYQLRRLIDSSYGEGNSAQYVISNSDAIQLDPDLVTTDLDEFRSIASRLHDQKGAQDLVPLATAAIELVRGPFLADLRYEDWVGRVEASIHAEVRELLLLLARGWLPSADLAIRAASALMLLDEFDEGAVVAMAKQLMDTGRRAAARNLLRRYARQLRDELDEAPPQPIVALLAVLDGRPASPRATTT